MIKEVKTNALPADFDPERGTTKRWLEGKTELEIVEIKKVYPPQNIMENAKAEYKKNKGTMTDKQRIDAIEIILGLN